MEKEVLRELAEKQQALVDELRRLHLEEGVLEAFKSQKQYYSAKSDYWSPNSSKKQFKRSWNNVCEHNVRDGVRQVLWFLDQLEEKRLNIHAGILGNVSKNKIYNVVLSLPLDEENRLSLCACKYW